MKKIKTVVIWWVIIMCFFSLMSIVQMRYKFNISSKSNDILKKIEKEKNLRKKPIDILKKHIKKQNKKVKKEVVHITLLRLLASYSFTFSEIQNYSDFALKLGISEFVVFKLIGDYYKDQSKMEVAAKYYSKAIKKFNKNQPIIYRFEFSEYPYEIYKVYQFLITYKEEQDQFVKAIRYANELLDLPTTIVPTTSKKGIREKIQDLKKKESDSE